MRALLRARALLLLLAAALLAAAPLAGIEAAPARAAECNGDECQGPPPAPEDPAPGTTVVEGPPNPPVHFPAARCPRGKHRVVRHGKPRCVAKSHSRRRFARHGREAEQA